MRDHNDSPQWLEILFEPGVAPILAALNDNHPQSVRELSHHLGGYDAAATANRAVRQLAAHGLVRRSDGGSCDQDDPCAGYQLTARGARFTHAATPVLRFMIERLPARVRAARPYR